MGPQTEDYIETVVTCEGDFYDPEFHAQLLEIKQRLQDLIVPDQRKLIVKKVEPWNSVRVTFNIPKEAAQRLKQLAEQGDQALRQLGILAVQVQGDRSISLTIAGKNNETTEVLFRTTGPPAPTLRPPVAQASNKTSSVFDHEDEFPGAAKHVEKTSRNIAEYLSQQQQQHHQQVPQAQDGSAFLDSIIGGHHTQHLGAHPKGMMGPPMQRPESMQPSLPPGFPQNSPHPFHMPSPTRSPGHTTAMVSSSVPLTQGVSPPVYQPPGITGHFIQGKSDAISPNYPTPPPSITNSNSPGIRTATSFAVSLPHSSSAVNNIQRTVANKDITSSSPLLVNLLQSDVGGHLNSLMQQQKGLPPEAYDAFMASMPPVKKKRRPRKPKAECTVSMEAHPMIDPGVILSQSQPPTGPMQHTASAALTAVAAAAQDRVPPVGGPSQDYGPVPASSAGAATTVPLGAVPPVPPHGHHPMRAPHPGPAPPVSFPLPLPDHVDSMSMHRGAMAQNNPSMIRGPLVQQGKPPVLSASKPQALQRVINPFTGQVEVMDPTNVGEGGVPSRPTEDSTRGQHPLAHLHPPVNPLVALHNQLVTSTSTEAPPPHHFHQQASSPSVGRPPHPPLATSDSIVKSLHVNNPLTAPHQPLSHLKPATSLMAAAAVSSQPSTTSSTSMTPVGSAVLPTCVHQTLNSVSLSASSSCSIDSVVSLPSLPERSSVPLSAGPPHPTATLSTAASHSNCAPTTAVARTLPSPSSAVQSSPSSTPTPLVMSSASTAVSQSQPTSLPLLPSTTEVVPSSHAHSSAGVHQPAVGPLFSEAASSHLSHVNPSSNPLLAASVETSSVSLTPPVLSPSSSSPSATTACSSSSQAPPADSSASQTQSVAEAVSSSYSMVSQTLHNSTPGAGLASSASQVPVVSETQSHSKSDPIDKGSVQCNHSLNPNSKGSSIRQAIPEAVLPKQLHDVSSECMSAVDSEPVVVRSNGASTSAEESPGSGSDSGIASQAATKVDGIAMNLMNHDSELSNHSFDEHGSTLSQTTGSPENLRHSPVNGGDRVLLPAPDHATEKPRKPSNKKEDGLGPAASEGGQNVMVVGYALEDGPHKVGNLTKSKVLNMLNPKNNVHHNDVGYLTKTLTAPEVHTDHLRHGFQSDVKCKSLQLPLVNGAASHEEKEKAASKLQVEGRPGSLDAVPSVCKQTVVSVDANKNSVPGIGSEQPGPPTNGSASSAHVDASEAAPAIVSPPPANSSSSPGSSTRCTPSSARDSDVLDLKQASCSHDPVEGQPSSNTTPPQPEPCTSKHGAASPPHSAVSYNLSATSSILTTAASTSSSVRPVLGLPLIVTQASSLVTSTVSSNQSASPICAVMPPQTVEKQSGHFSQALSTFAKMHQSSIEVKESSHSHTHPLQRPPLHLKAVDATSNQPDVSPVAAEVPKSPGGKDGSQVTTKSHEMNSHGSPCNHEEESGSSNPSDASNKASMVSKGISILKPLQDREMEIDTVEMVTTPDMKKVKGIKAKTNNGEQESPLSLQEDAALAHKAMLYATHKINSEHPMLAKIPSAPIMSRAYVTADVEGKADLALADTAMVTPPIMAICPSDLSLMAIPGVPSAKFKMQKPSIKTHSITVTSAIELPNNSGLHLTSFVQKSLSTPAVVVNSAHPITSPGFPHNLTESVQKVMKSLPLDTTPPTSPNFNRCVPAVTVVNAIATAATSLKSSSHKSPPANRKLSNDTHAASPVPQPALSDASVTGILTVATESDVKQDIPSPTSSDSSFVSEHSYSARLPSGAGASGVHALSPRKMSPGSQQHSPVKKVIPAKSELKDSMEVKAEAPQTDPSLDPSVPHNEVKSPPPDVKIEEVHKTEVKVGEVHKIDFKVGEAHKTEVKVGEVHKPNVKVGELHKTEVKVGEVHKAEIKAGDVHKAEIKAGEVHKAEVKVGEVHKTVVKVGEVHKAEVKVEEIHNTRSSKRKLSGSSIDASSSGSDSAPKSKAPKLEPTKSEPDQVEPKVEVKASKAPSGAPVNSEPEEVAPKPARVSRRKSRESTESQKSSCSNRDDGFTPIRTRSTDVSEERRTPTPTSTEGRVRNVRGESSDRSLSPAPSTGRMATRSSGRKAVNSEPEETVVKVARGSKRKLLMASEENEKILPTSSSDDDVVLSELKAKAEVKQCGTSDDKPMATRAKKTANKTDASSNKSKSASKNEQISDVSIKPPPVAASKNAKNAASSKDKEEEEAPVADSGKRSTRSCKSKEHCELPAPVFNKRRRTSRDKQ